MNCRDTIYDKNHFSAKIGLLSFFIIPIIAFIGIFSLKAQQIPDFSDQVKIYHKMRAYDSVIASRIPEMKLPDEYRNRSFPVSVDNSQYMFFPGILDQKPFPNCQQHSGVSYTYAYEINRIRNLDGSLPENRYPANYTFNFMNKGENMDGVSFFYSWDVLKQQGHPTINDYGTDKSMSYILWMNGYDKYNNGMHNRLNAIYSIPTNTEEGILTLKHYLNDHLDGSAAGGVACFGASANFIQTNFKKLPAGSPEAGKDVIIAFYPMANHGMTIVGYNDSIRYDLNGDSQFTNDLDITGDGVVDVRDWEIGAFRMANSFGTWWSDQGFCYILYRAMALNYDYPNSTWSPNRGVWNHCVYILEAETDYQPMLTIKVRLTHNLRNMIRLKAGVSPDTSKLFPAHVIEFPFITFQGGSFGMQGSDTIPGYKTIELGFDITPLLSYIESDENAKFFLILEERDSLHEGEGIVNSCSFIDYTNGIHEMIVQQSDIPINDNTLTLLSATGTVHFTKVHITTENLPPFNSSQPYQVRLEASGGKAPLQWSLKESYEKKRKDTLFPVVTQLRLQAEAPSIAYTKVTLPFGFPFYGKRYDTIYVNLYGFISFDAQQLPYVYLKDEEGMLKRNIIISPAFSMNAWYNIQDTTQGIWMESNTDWVCIRWKKCRKDNTIDTDNFALRLYKNGEFEFLYGNFSNPSPEQVSYSGYSKGDQENFDIWTNWNSSSLSNKTYRFSLQPIPSEIALSKEGILNIAAADTGFIYEIPVKVTDANKISFCKSYYLSTGLIFTQEIVCSGDHLLKFGVPAHFKLSLRNIGNEILQDLRLKLVIGDSSILLTDSLISIPVMAPGAFVDIENAFSFQLRYPLPDVFPVDFTIIALSTEHQWQKKITIPVAAPEINVVEPVIFDGYDGLLDPGEVADLVIKIQNIGSLFAENIDLLISTSDPFVNIVSQSFQTIDRINSFSETDMLFQLKASKNAPSGHNAEMLLTLTDHLLVNKQIPFTLVLGKLPVAIVRLSTDSGSASAIKMTLDSLQVPYEFHYTLPARINCFSSLFVLLGINPSSCHSLTMAESTKLSGYLSQGGKLYMESYAPWYSQDKTSLHNYFRYTAQKVHVYFYHSVLGTPGSFTESMNFNYVSPVIFALYNIVPLTPAFGIFTNTDSVPKCLQFAYGGDDYKTIGSIVEFGSLINGEPPSEKITLMRRYLDFFDVATPGPKALFHCSQNSVCRWHTVDFTDDSFDNIASWQWEFPGGTPSVSTAQNPTVQYMDAGNYDVKLTVGDGIYSRSITKKNFINVHVCAGAPELTTKPELSVYPNPARNRVSIKLPGLLSQEVKLSIFDLMGRKIMERRFNRGNMEGIIPLDVSSLQRGLYIIKLISGSFNETTKVVIE